MAWIKWYSSSFIFHNNRSSPLFDNFQLKEVNNSSDAYHCFIECWEKIRTEYEEMSLIPAHSVGGRSQPEPSCISREQPVFWCHQFTRPKASSSILLHVLVPFPLGSTHRSLRSWRHWWSVLRSVPSLASFCSSNGFWSCCRFFQASIEKS